MTIIILNRSIVTTAVCTSIIWCTTRMATSSYGCWIALSNLRSIFSSKCNMCWSRSSPWICQSWLQTCYQTHLSEDCVRKKSAPLTPRPTESPVVPIYLYPSGSRAARKKFVAARMSETGRLKCETGISSVLPSIGSSCYFKRAVLTRRAAEYGYLNEAVSDLRIRKEWMWLGNAFHRAAQLVAFVFAVVYDWDETKWSMNTNLDVDQHCHSNRKPGRVPLP